MTSQGYVTCGGSLPKTHQIQAYHTANEYKRASRIRETDLIRIVQYNTVSGTLGPIAVYTNFKTILILFTYRKK